MIRATVYTRCLNRAAQILGGSDALARNLLVPPAVLLRWMTGEVRPPQAVFLKAVDIVLSVDFMLDIGELHSLLAQEPKAPARILRRRGCDYPVPAAKTQRPGRRR